MITYYGVQRSDEYLAHYGIKGMKWGVRKAVESHNERKLDREYRKAVRKLQKLNLQADKRIQSSASKNHMKKAIAAGAIGLVGLGGVMRSNAISNQAAQLAYENSAINKKRRKVNVVSSGKGIKTNGSALLFGPVNESIADAYKIVGAQGHGFKHPAFNPAHNMYSELYAKELSKNTTGAALKKIRNISAGVAVGGLGTAAYQTGKAIAAKRRATDKGHAKAVAKRDAWKREMTSAFKGTKYGSKIKNQNRKNMR